MSEITGNFHAVSCSGGKDSTAMFLLMIERDMPIDVVLTADTGMEFPEMYEHMQKLDDLLYRERGIHITTLRHPMGFEYLMFEEPKVKPSSIENRQRLGVPPLRQRVARSPCAVVYGTAQNAPDPQRGEPAEKGTERPALCGHCRRRAEAHQG